MKKKIANFHLKIAGSQVKVPITQKCFRSIFLLNPQANITVYTFNAINFSHLCICVIFALISCVLFRKHAAFNWCNFPYNFPLLLAFPFLNYTPPRMNDNNPVDMIHRKNSLLFLHCKLCKINRVFRGDLCIAGKKESLKEGLSEMIASNWFASITSNRFCVKPLIGISIDRV